MTAVQHIEPGDARVVAGPGAGGVPPWQRSGVTVRELKEGTDIEERMIGYEVRKGNTERLVVTINRTRTDGEWGPPFLGIRIWMRRPTDRTWVASHRTVTLTARDDALVREAFDQLGHACSSSQHRK